MRKSDYRGWKDVFCFSLVQGIKQKSYVVLLVIMMVVMLVSPLFMNLFEKDEEETIDITVEKLVIFDEVGISVPYEKAFEGSVCENVVVEMATEAASFEEYIKGYEAEDSSKEMAVRISFQDAGLFDLKFVMSSNKELTEEACEEVVKVFDSFFTEEKLKAIDVTEEQFAFINQKVYAKGVFFLGNAFSVGEGCGIILGIRD